MANSNPPGFAFNPPAGGLFGGAAPATSAPGATAAPTFSFGATPSGSMFGASGQPAQAPGASAPAPFGAGTGAGLFGGAAPATSAPAATAAPTFSFGATPGGSMFGNASKPAGAGLFGAAPPAATSAAAAPAAPAPAIGGSGSLFGGLSLGTTAAPPAAAAPAAPAFGKPAAPAATASPPKPSFGFGAPAPAQGGPGAPAAAPKFGFGAPAATTTAAPPAAPAPAAGSSTGGGGGLFGSGAPSFGKPPASTSAPPATTAAAAAAPPAPTAPADMSKTQTTAPAAAAKATTASGSLSVPAPTAPPPTVGGIPLLKNKTLEEILNKWSTDLESYTQEFRSQATELQKWDRTILENGATISRLYEELQSTESLQREIDQNLEYIEAQQNELDSTLDSYHAQIKALFQSEAQSTHLRTTPADEERERAYTLAENLNKQLDEMSQQLSVIIDDMNASRSGGTSGVAGDVMPATVTAGKPVAPEDDNPIGAIVRILNEHLTSLEWIDKTSNDLASRIVELKRVGTEATEQADRVHRGQSGIAIGPGSVVAPLGGTFGSTPSRLRPTSGFGATTPGGR